MHKFNNLELKLLVVGLFALVLCSRAIGNTQEHFPKEVESCLRKIPGLEIEMQDIDNRKAALDNARASLPIRDKTISDLQSSLEIQQKSMRERVDKLMAEDLVFRQRRSALEARHSAPAKSQKEVNEIRALVEVFNIDMDKYTLRRSGLIKENEGIAQSNEAFRLKVIERASFAKDVEALRATYIKITAAFLERTRITQEKCLSEK